MSGDTTTMNSNTQKVVSFDSIDPFELNMYSALYKPAKSAIGQIVVGMDHQRQQILGIDSYTSNKKEAINEYQKFLYPYIAALSSEIVEKYKTIFVNNPNIDSEAKRQVWGANLNGSRNNGQLTKFVGCKSVNNFVRYQNVQFGQLLNLLKYRLGFIINRKPEMIERYANNKEQFDEFNVLKSAVVEFSEYLRNDVSTRWKQIVDEARAKDNTTNKQVRTTTYPNQLTRSYPRNYRRGFNEGGRGYTGRGGRGRFNPRGGRGYNTRREYTTRETNYNTR